MVLVDAYRVEPAFGGVFELIHEIVVHVMRAAGVEQGRMDVDPDRGMLLAEVIRQLGVRHQMEPHQLHGIVLPIAAATEDGAASASPVIFRPRSGGGKDIARRPLTACGLTLRTCVIHYRLQDDSRVKSAPRRGGPS